MFDFDDIYPAHHLLEALNYLVQHPTATVLAGGSDLLVHIRNRKLTGSHLLSIYQIDELRGIEEVPDGICIGALTSFSSIASDPMIQSYIPVLAEAACSVGGPQIRNIGTIGGNICNGVPSADSASTLLALDAQLEITSAYQTRYIPITEFYLGTGQVDLHPGELLTKIYLARSSFEGYHGHFEKYAMRRAMDISTVNCSCNLKLSPDSMTISTLRLAYGVAAPVPLRMLQLESEACGMPACQKTIDQLMVILSRILNPRDSWRASRDFRIHILLTLTKNILTKLIQEACDAPPCKN